MNKELLYRTVYLKQLHTYRDNPLFKVITGVRRAGKTMILRLFIRDLLNSGVSEQNIIFFDLETLKYDHVRDYATLHRLVKERLPVKGRNYIFLDEIQQVDQWERALLSIREETNSDIYVTSSNAWKLPLKTVSPIAGRYVEIGVLPLSFREYLECNKDGSVAERFDRYVKFGGFPFNPQFSGDDETANDCLSGIYNTVIVKDVFTRQSVRDVAALGRLVMFLAYGTGTYVSPLKLSRSFTGLGQGEVVKYATVANYLNMLEKAFIVYPAYRYDLKEREASQVLGKYYIVDTGLRNMLLNHDSINMSHTLETLVYFELRRRGYQVYTGKHYNRAVDFVGVRQDRKRCIQVLTTFADADVETVKRKIAPLRSVREHFERTIISMDASSVTAYQNIENRNIIDFLLEDDDYGRGPESAGTGTEARRPL
jgi:predicted AAA+ superfamily ATPase